MSNSSQGRAGWIAVAACAVVAAIVRFVYLQDVASSPVLEVPMGESGVFARWARGSFDGVHRAPLFGWWIHAWYQATESFVTVRLVNAVLSVGTVVLVADVARRWAGAVAAWVAGLSLALAWPWVLHVSELTPTTLAGFLVALSLWGLLRAGWDDALRWSVVSAVSAGLAIVALPWTVAVWLPLAGAAWWVWPRSPRGPGRAILMIAIAMAIPFAVSMRNAIVHDTFGISREIPRLFALNQTEAGSDPSTLIPPAKDPAPAPFPGTEVDPGPSSLVRHLPGRWVALFGAGERGHALNPYFQRAQSRILSLPIWPGWSWLLFGTALAFFSVRDRRSLAGPGLFFALGSLLLLLVVVHATRRLPLTIPMALLTGVAVAQLPDRWRVQRGRALLALALAATIGLASQWDEFRLPARQIDADGRSLAIRAAANFRTGHPAEAADDYARAILATRKMDPQPEHLEWEIRRDQTRVFARLRRIDDMKVELDGLRTRYPHDPTVVALIGDMHLITGDLPRARQHFKSALDMDPGNNDAKLGMGWWCIRVDQETRAPQHFRVVLARDPENVRALTGMAWVAAADNLNPAQAMRLAKKSLAIDPTLSETHQLLGTLYRLEKNLPAAVWHLRESLRLDPLNMAARRWLTRSGAGTEHSPGEEDNMP